MTTNERHVIATTQAPQAIGPYSQAIASGSLVFCSGQIALDPTSGQMSTGDVTEQTHQALRNLRAVLQAAGSDLDQIVKTTVFLVDMGDFAAMNAVYGTYFTDRPPARSTIAVVALPRGARVEVECIALASA